MKKACRDCGYQLEPAARGCPRCALNLEAENMIDRLIWLKIVPAILIVGIVAVLIIYHFLK